MSQYLKPDSELGYVEDSAQIEFLQFNNLRHVVLGCMLGDFNEVGNYVIDPEIVEELISMEKYLVQTYDNIELCKSVLKLDKQVSFMVTYEGNRATLSLVEKLNYEANFQLNSGTYSNINEYVLDSVETSGEVNRNVIYDRWNIKMVPGQLIDIFNCDDSSLEKYFGIVNRFKYLLEANKTLLEKEEELEEIEASYSNELLEILGHYSKLKTAVMETIKETLQEKEGAVSVKKPFFAKTFNEILENAIEKNLSVINETEQKEFLLEKHNATLNVNIKREDTLDIVKVENIEEKHETTPKIQQLRMQPSYESKSIAELGSELVGANKQVVNKLSGEKEESVELDLIQRTILAVGEKKGLDIVLPEKPKEKEKNEQKEKDKLISTLAIAGLKKEIGIVEPKLTQETKAEQVPVVKPVVENKAKKANAKVAGGSDKAKKAGGGGGKGGTKKKKDKKEKKSSNGSKKETPETKPIKVYSDSAVRTTGSEFKSDSDLKIKPERIINVSHYNDREVKKETTDLERTNINSVMHKEQKEAIVSGERLIQGQVKVDSKIDLTQLDEIVRGNNIKLANTTLEGENNSEVDVEELNLH